MSKNFDDSATVETMRMRDVSLRGDAAARWFRNSGWMIRPAARNELHAFGDQLLDPRIALSRMWTTTAELEVIPDSGTTRALLIVEGNAVLESGVVRREVGPWDLISFADEAPARLTADGGLGFIQIVLRNRSLWASRTPVSAPAVFTDMPSAQVLVATTNSALNVDLSGNTTGIALLAQALEHLIGVIIARCEESPRRAAVASSQLDRAMRMIAARHADPEFDVSTLAREMHLGRRQLTRVISRTGMTPSEAIRTFRLATAHTAAHASGESTPSAFMAKQAGFRDLRALRRAQQLNAA